MNLRASGRVCLNIFARCITTLRIPRGIATGAWLRRGWRLNWGFGWSRLGALRALGLGRLLRGLLDRGGFTGCGHNRRGSLQGQHRINAWRACGLNG